MKVIRKKFSFPKFFCKLFISGFVFYLLFSVFLQFSRVRAKKNILNNLNSEIEFYTKKRVKLSSALDIKDGEFERAAREKGFSKKNERIFVVSNK